MKMDLFEKPILSFLHKSEDIITTNIIVYRKYDLMNRTTDSCIIARSYIFYCMKIHIWKSIFFYYLLLFFLPSYHTWHDNIFYL